MNSKKTAALIIAISSYTAASCAATTYYVDPVGSDKNPGTSASPLQTIQAAANKVNPGDTVIVRDGVYTMNSSILIDINRGGTSGNPVTFKADHPNGAILDGSNNDTTYGVIFETGVAYLKLQGFEIRGFGKTAINFSGLNSNVSISGNDIHDIGRVCTDSSLGYVGMYIGQSSAITVNNNIIRNIGRFAPGENGCNPTNAYYQNHDHGIYVDGVTNLTIQNNTIYGINRGWGIQFYSGKGNLSSGVQILNNNFSYPNPYRDGHIVFASPGVTQVSVANNVFYQPTNQALNFNTGITLSGVTVSNNTAYSVVTSKTSPNGVTFSGNKDNQ